MPKRRKPAPPDPATIAAKRSAVLAQIIAAAHQAGMPPARMQALTNCTSLDEARRLIRVHSSRAPEPQPEPDAAAEETHADAINPRHGHMTMKGDLPC